MLFMNYEIENGIIQLNTPQHTDKTKLNFSVQSNNIYSHNFYFFNHKKHYQECNSSILQVPEWLGLLEIKWQNTTHSRLKSRDMTATILPISTSDHFINDRTNKTPANTDFTRLLRFILIICDVVLFGCYGFPIRPKKCGNRLTACKQKYIFHFWLIIYKIFT